MSYIRTPEIRRKNRLVQLRAWRKLSKRARAKRAAGQKIHIAAQVAHSMPRSKRQLAVFEKGSKKSHRLETWRKSLPLAQKAAAKTPRSEKQLKALAKARRNIVCPSKVQKCLLERLRRNEVFGLKLDYPVGVYKLDIACPSKMRCVEVDGSYWHSFNKTNYKARDKFLKNKGWKILRIHFERRKHLHKKFPKVFKFLTGRSQSNYYD